MSDTSIVRRGGRAPSCEPQARVTKSLLGYGVLAGPFYVVAVLAQALIRPGFDITRDDASLLSNGSFGWVQVTNFIITGLMVVAFAVGVRRALRPGRGAAWAAGLLGLYGIGLIAAGVFVADPMNGFPAGTPIGHPSSLSVHGLLHIASAGAGFASLVAASFVLRHRLSAEGFKGLALVSGVTGVIFAVSFVAVASGSSSRMVVVGFWMAILLVWCWVAAIAIHLYRGVSWATPVPVGNAAVAA